jgi:uncharacterized protein YegP (UPF0339 family)
MFTIRKTKAEDYSYELKAKNGQVILSGGDYVTESAIKNTIESVKRNSQKEESFERKVNNFGKPYFVLKARNGQIVGVSGLYLSEASRDNGILSVMKNAPDAEIIEI